MSEPKKKTPHVEPADLSKALLTVGANITAINPSLEAEAALCKQELQALADDEAEKPAAEKPEAEKPE